jgi:Dyp-type peroxidase family
MSTDPEARATQSRNSDALPGAAERAAPTIPEPVLEVDEIQGNVIPGFNKDYQAFVFLEITDLPRARDWLASMVDNIATMREVLEYSRRFKAVRSATGREMEEVATWLNVAFSHAGLRKFTPEADSFPESGAFRIGLTDERSSLLEDPSDPASEGHVSRWVVGGTHSPVDVLVIGASDSPDELRKLLHDVFDGTLRDTTAAGDELLGGTFSLVRVEHGQNLPPPLAGHEHFGFRDGVSQPGVRGRASSGLEDYVTQRHIDPTDPASVRFGKPGQALIWPGEFVLGLERQNDQTPLEPLEPLPVQPEWARNGSFLVFRRLRQDVAAFQEFVRAGAAQLREIPGFEDMTDARFAALLVGRWPSGAPLIRSPEADAPEIGADDLANNHFNYAGSAPPVRTVGPRARTIKGAPADSPGFLCPHAAHIRKVNPRDLSTESGVSTLRRLLRRGIPYGPVYVEGEIDGMDRGLLFLAYMSSIEEQFELLQQRWSNTADKPQEGGHDPIIGQTESAGGRTRSVTLTSPAGARGTINVPEEWVVATGGGYFFSPSISTLRRVLAGA